MHLRNILRFSLLASTLLGAAACGNNPAGPTGTPGTPGQLSVAVTAPNGDPISGATVWVPAGSASLKAMGVQSTSKGLVDAAGNSCADVPEANTSAACTGSDGRALLLCDGENPVDVKFAKGSFTGILQATCGQGELATASFAATGSASIAVVTGAFDRMEDVLAKLGFGTVNDFGRLELGTESFTLYDGNESLPATYSEFSEVLLDPAALASHDIIFINCDDFGLGEELESGDTATKIANLREYVMNGGKIYVTDLSYDYVEQAFPNYLDFKDGGSGMTAETPGAAETGSDRHDENAAIGVSAMGDWLDNVTVNTGNPDDNCFETTVNGKLGARNADGSVFIADLLSGWGVIDGPEASPDGPVTQWVRGTDLEGAAERPLTTTFEVGDQGGRVLYTSYHTAEGCPTQGFWPQERILQYLVFEL